MAAQTRAQPSRRKHNGPYGSAVVFVRNTVIQVSDDAAAEAADSTTVFSVARSVFPKAASCINWTHVSPADRIFNLIDIKSHI